MKPCDLENMTDEFVKAPKEIADKIRENNRIYALVKTGMDEVELASLRRAHKKILTEFNGTSPIDEWDSHLALQQKLLDNEFEIDKLLMSRKASVNSLNQLFHTNVENVHKTVDPEAFERIRGEIEEYTGIGYMTESETSRAGGDMSWSYIRQALDDVPENFDGVSYRGSRLTDTQLQMVKEVGVGGVLKSNHVLSSSLNWETATAFTKGDLTVGRKDLMLHIRGKGHDIGHVSSMPEEQEVLIKGGKSYQVLGIEETDSQLQMIIQEIDDEVAALIPEGVPRNSKILGLMAMAGAVAPEGKADGEESPVDSDLEGLGRWSMFAMGAIALGKGNGRRGVYYISKMAQFAEKMPKKGKIPAKSVGNYLRGKVPADELKGMQLEGNLPGMTDADGNVEFGNLAYLMKEQAGKDLTITNDLPVNKNSNYYSMEKDTRFKDYVDSTAKDDYRVTGRTSELFSLSGVTTPHFDADEIMFGRSTVTMDKGKKVLVTSEVQADSIKIKENSDYLTHKRDWLQKGFEDQMMLAADIGADSIVVPLGRPAGLGYRSEEIVNSMYVEGAKVHKTLNKLAKDYGGSVKIIPAVDAKIEFHAMMPDLDDLAERLSMGSLNFDAYNAEFTHKNPVAAAVQLVADGRRVNAGGDDVDMEGVERIADALSDFSKRSTWFPKPMLRNEIRTVFGKELMQMSEKFDYVDAMINVLNTPNVPRQTIEIIYRALDDMGMASIGKPKYVEYTLPPERNRDVAIPIY